MCKCRPEGLFAKFTEYNEWEGETWHYFLPVDGNQSGLAKLERILGQYDPSQEHFELNLTDLVPEWEVDVLVKHTDVFYRPVYTKVTGRIRDFYAEEILYQPGWDSGEGSRELNLGKGRIEELFDE